jgi:hypothetical protein
LQNLINACSAWECPAGLKAAAQAQDPVSNPWNQDEGLLSSAMRKCRG